MSKTEILKRLNQRKAQLKKDYEGCIGYGACASNVEGIFLTKGELNSINYAIRLVKRSMKMKK